MSLRVWCTQNRVGSLARFSLSLLLAGICLYAAEAQAQNLAEHRNLKNTDFIRNPQYHGDFLDSKSMVLVEQKNDWATIILRENSRAPGGPAIYLNKDTGADESVIRYDQDYILAKIRAEILVPAEPNYIANPGDRYRITVKGVTVAPEYVRVFEVDAADALDAVTSEIFKLASRAHGRERDALFWGVMIAKTVLNKTQHLPAEIPLTVLLSDVGKIRIQDKYLERSAQGEQDRQTAVAGGASRQGTFADDSGPGARAERGLAVPAAMGETKDRNSVPNKNPGQRFQGEGFQNQDHRQNQIRELGAPKDKRGMIGQAGEALTAPPGDYPAIALSQRENHELMMGGPVRSALGAEVEAAASRAPRSGSLRGSSRNR